MSSTTRTRRPRFGRGDGPRASLRQLLPFVFEQKGVLVLVAFLSILAAAATLTLKDVHFEQSDDNVTYPDVETPVQVLQLTSASGGTGGSCR